MNDKKWLIDYFKLYKSSIFDENIITQLIKFKKLIMSTTIINANIQGSI